MLLNSEQRSHAQLGLSSSQGVTNVPKGGILIVALLVSYFPLFITASIPYTYNGSSTKKDPFLMLRIRGGEKNNNDETAEIKDPTKISSKVSKTTRKPWSPLSSAFQMNIDAKDELINDQLLIQDSRGSSSTAAVSSLSLGGGGGSVGVTSKRKTVYEQRKVVSDGNDWSNSIRTDEDVSTASNRLLLDEDDEFELSDNEDFSDDMYDALSEEYQGSFVIENDTGLESENIELEDNYDEEDTETPFTTDGSEESNENENVVKKSEVRGRGEDSDMQGHFKLDDVDDVSEVNLKTASTVPQAIEEDDIYLPEVNMKEERQDLDKTYDIERKVSVGKKVKNDMISTDGEWHVLEDTASSNMAVTTKLQSSAVVEDSQHYDAVPSRESLQEIVYEEWKDAETDVESSYYSVKSERGGKNKKGKKKGNNKKHDKKDKDVEEAQKDQTIHSKSIRARPEREPKPKVVREAPRVDKSEQSSAPLLTPFREGPSSPYVSSGWWSTIDRMSSLGLSEINDDLKVSKHLRTLRKKAAKATGLHGVLSGKGRESSDLGERMNLTQELNEDDLGAIRRRLAAIENARRRVAAKAASTELNLSQSSFQNVPRWRRPFVRKNRHANAGAEDRLTLVETEKENVDGEISEELNLDDPTPKIELSPEEIAERVALLTPQEEEEISEARNELKMKRQKLEEIEVMIQENQKRIVELQCQKDDIQQRPNPLFKYSSPEKQDESDSKASSRTFNFPEDSLVTEYIDELVGNGRLRKMNHTELWRTKGDKNEDDEHIGDDLLTPSGDARKLYEEKYIRKRKAASNGGNVGGGSWLLRQTLGKGASLGEKLGDTVENAAYTGVCAAVMSILATAISALHGVTVMKHSDIRLFVETDPDLPPVSKAIFSQDNYAEEAIGKAIRKGSKKKKKRKNIKGYQYGGNSGDDVFIQRDAVVETLLSHCQISAPLLKLFPLAWQRAILGNIITLIAAIVSDFSEGLQFQILGHSLSFNFKPITEADMIQHIGDGGFHFNHRRSKPEEFEAAVKATAEDVSKGLAFLDRWHERALGGDLLRAQIGNLIARIVLTLVDEVLHSARIDLWSAQAGGPRVVAGLEYRSDSI